MTGLQIAELARVRFSKKLSALGAHALEVAEEPQGSKKNFAVVAHFAKKPKTNVPAVLSLKSGGKAFTVPLRVKISQPFKPE